jgi:hypothetical protein
MSAAERMRRYRARLRARGVRRVEARTADPWLEAVRFPAASLLSPGERDVLRRFCAGLRRLPVAPRKVAVFGSRVRGGSDERSDLDAAVSLDGPRTAGLESALSAIALAARKPYASGEYGIFLRPVALYEDERPASALAGAVAREGEVIWTRPRSRRR